MNTKAGFLLILAVFFQIALVQSALAQSLKMSVAENGEAALWRASSGQKEQIKDSVEIGFGDTLFTLADADARVWLESQSTLLVKGGSVIVLNGKESSIDISLEDGQVFFDRNQPHELTSLRILTKGYSFTPTGTAAAVKTTRQGLPTVAVLRGSVLMASSQGGSVSVEARQFGTVNSAGVPVSGSLNEKGLQQLEAWSGVKAEAAADQNVNAQEQDAPDS
ncbi:MAG: FecR family protein, partial [Chitinispirillales bacterium]|nr:FecR family protein [Chitinispirillales bacterium]